MKFKSRNVDFITTKNYNLKPLSEREGRAARREAKKSDLATLEYRKLFEVKYQKI